MSVGYVLFWLSAMLVGFGLVRELRARRPENFGWLLKYAGLAVFGAIATQLYGQEVAGHLLGMAVFVAIVGPGMGFARMERSALAGDWAAARRLANTVRLLHPFDGYWRLPRLYRALELDAAGDPRAEGLFAALAHDPRWKVRAEVYRLRRLESWEPLLTLPGSESPLAVTDSLPFLARLRALGECGRRSELLAAAEVAYTPNGGVLTLLRHPTLLYTFAFYGEGKWVHRILMGPLRSMPPWLRDFWLATAGINAGGHAEIVAREAFASDRFERFREGVGALNRRRQAPPSVPPSDHERARLTRLAESVNAEIVALPEMYEGGGWRKMPATTGLSLLLVGVFLAQEWMGGSESYDVAVKMGALVMTPAEAPQLWRLFTANFLHFGWVHLVMNVGALFALGPFVEKNLGGLRYLILLAVSGIGSMALTAYVFYAGRNILLVGASGAIMGLVGATAAVLLGLRKNDRSGLVGKRLRSVGFILLLQFTFDFLTPKVSLAAHAGGALCGFAAALLIDALRQAKR